jgi:hypothetical protein
MRKTLTLLTFLLLSTTPALAQTPAASATPTTTARTEELLSRILKTLEEQLSMKSQPVAVRWDYRCTDVGTMQSAEAVAASLSSFGSQGWEYIGSLGLAPMPGSVRVCFKRPGGVIAELSPTGGELGCNPTCSSAETCYKGVCINACNPACGNDQYCANDHHCRTRTRPRK